MFLNRFVSLVAFGDIVFRNRVNESIKDTTDKMSAGDLKNLCLVTEAFNLLM